MRAKPNAVVVSEHPPDVQVTVIAGSELVARFNMSCIEAAHLVSQIQLAVARCTAIRHADKEPLGRNAL
jgi:hypothetical protein